jgi:lactate dehydrogenase-like 2-hydroxyacid dehydrogenase
MKSWLSQWTPFDYCGKGLAGSTVGFFGLGRIGQSVAEKVVPFHPARILYHNRRPRPDLPAHYEYGSFDELLAQSDFLIITASVGSDVVGVFNRTVFEKMKNDSILINISRLVCTPIPSYFSYQTPLRGKVVNTDDLLEALTNGKIGAAGLDVTEPEPLPDGHPLFSLKNCGNNIFPSLSASDCLSDCLPRTSPPPLLQPVSGCPTWAKRT